MKYNERQLDDMSGILLYGLILFDIIEGKKYIGGPAINIALHMAFHGECPTLISCLGDDELGNRAEKLLTDNNVSTKFIKIDQQHETGWVRVFLDEKGEPSFEITQPVAYDFITLDDEQLSSLSETEFDIVYFGTVVQRTDVSADTLRKILKHVSYKHSFFDINLRKGHINKDVVAFSLQHTDILKLNEEELILVAAMFDLETREEQGIVDWLFAEYPAEMILLTRGENGVSVFVPDKRNDIPG
ncbi:MAG: hypothetical protein K8R77_05485, partial [Anaerolineaceae bacterium]|nr:hypothetical protein [Anaerolineaceae bacterium]